MWTSSKAGGTMKQSDQIHLYSKRPDTVKCNRPDTVKRKRPDTLIQLYSNRPDTSIRLYSNRPDTVKCNRPENTFTFTQQSKAT